MAAKILLFCENFFIFAVLMKDSKMLKLAVVILNWNGRKFLEQYLPILLRTLPDYAEAVVCDNASTDDSVAFM